jgi:2-polyprenyl-3-methyl-5-hydroxy-6-metoxy-1,4-benzoquinol methylase
METGSIGTRFYIPWPPSPRAFLRPYGRITAGAASLSNDRESARSYFDRLAPEYDRAFRLQGHGPVSALVNRFFRGPTFARRMRLLESLFAQTGLQGRSVLDLGCGSGQVSLLAASMGARVHGIDIAPRMLAIARDAAEHAGLAAAARFEEGDVSTVALPPSDVVLLVGVVEYYADFQPLVRRAAEAARGMLVVAHTNRVAYRMLLRKLLFSMDGAALYFHPMTDVAAAAESGGVRLVKRLPDHAFTVLVFDRRG